MTIISAWYSTAKLTIKQPQLGGCSKWVFFCALFCPSINCLGNKREVPCKIYYTSSTHFPAVRWVFFCDLQHVKSVCHAESVSTESMAQMQLFAYRKGHRQVCLPAHVVVFTEKPVGKLAHKPVVNWRSPFHLAFLKRMCECLCTVPILYGMLVEWDDMSEARSCMASGPDPATVVLLISETDFRKCFNFAARSTVEVQARIQ